MTKLEQFGARLEKAEAAGQDWIATKNKIKYIVAAAIGAGTLGGTSVSTWLVWLRGWLD